MFYFLVFSFYPFLFLVSLCSFLFLSIFHCHSPALLLLSFLLPFLSPFLFINPRLSTLRYPSLAPFLLFSFFFCIFFFFVFVRSIFLYVLSPYLSSSIFSFPSSPFPVFYLFISLTLPSYLSFLSTSSTFPFLVSFCLMIVLTLSPVLFFTLPCLPSFLPYACQSFSPPRHLRTIRKAGACVQPLHRNAHLRNKDSTHILSTSTYIHRRTHNTTVTHDI